MKIQASGTSLIALAMAAGGASAATVLPTVFEAGHVYVTPTLASGETLKLNVDTGGGGWNWGVTLPVASKYKFAPATCDGQEACFAAPAFAPGKGLPALNPRGIKTVDAFPAEFTSGSNQGTLSGWYLVSGTWTFDYPGQRLVLEDAGWKPEADAKSTPIGLPSTAKGDIGAPYPSVTIKVDGKPIDLLLDTGATAHPTPAAMKVEGLQTAPDGYAGGSYITTSVMNAWHKAHPEWPLLDDADDLFGAGKATRVIRVPSVEIAGWTTGPVWFTERGDRNFGPQGLSRYMDKEIHGSAGGNIFAAFRMTLDYRNRSAWFSCVKGCKKAAH